LALGERLLDLAHLRPGEMADLGREALERGRDERECREQLRMPVALEDLRRARRRLDAEPLARDPLDLGVHSGVLPDGPRQLADPESLDRPSDALAVPVDRERPAGELEPEGHRLGVHAVRAAHADRLSVFLCPVRHDLERTVQPVQDQCASLLDGQRQRCVEHIGRGQPVVEPAPVVAQRSRHEIDERRDVVTGLPLPPTDLVRRRHAGRLANPGDDVGRHGPDRGPPLERRELDLEHPLELPLVRPDPGHGGPGVASDHAAILDVTSGGSPHAVAKPAHSRHRISANVVRPGDRMESGWWDGVPHDDLAHYG
jgi:hypothetical protein